MPEVQAEPKARPRICIRFILAPPSSKDASTQRRPRSDFVLLHAPVECAAAEAEDFRRLADFSAEALERVLYQKTFDLFEAHLFEAALAAFARGAEAEVCRFDFVRAREEDCALNYVVELAHVAGPVVGAH